MVEKQRICDVCGYTENFNMKDPGDHGWMTIGRPIITDKNMDVCPKCTEKLRNIVEKFFDGEKDEKLVIGDVVDLYVPGCNYRQRAVFITECDDCCTLMQSNGMILTVDLEKHAYILTKTGEYCDILGCLEKVRW